MLINTISQSPNMLDRREEKKDSNKNKQKMFKTKERRKIKSLKWSLNKLMWNVSWREALTKSILKKL